METTIVCCGNIGIMEKNMDTEVLADAMAREVKDAGPVGCMPARHQY